MILCILSLFLDFARALNDDGMSFFMFLNTVCCVSGAVGVCTRGENHDGQAKGPGVC